MRTACVFLSAKRGCRFGLIRHNHCCANRTHHCSSGIRLLQASVRCNRTTFHHANRQPLPWWRGMVREPVKRGKVAGQPGRGSRGGGCRTREVRRNEKHSPIATPKSTRRRASQIPRKPKCYFFLFLISFITNSFRSIAEQTTTNYNGIALT